jgi:hypothetical protein
MSGQRKKAQRVSPTKFQKKKKFTSEEKNCEIIKMTPPANFSFYMMQKR